MNKNSLFLYIGLALLAAALISSGYIGVRTYLVTQTIEELQTLQGERKIDKDVDPMKVLQANIASVEADQILWAEAIANMQSTIPKAEDTVTPVVAFLSYSSNDTGTISVSGVTRAASTNQLGDIARTINAFNKHLSFRDVFVPSISAGISENGAIYNFSMTMQYQKQN